MAPDYKEIMQKLQARSRKRREKLAEIFGVSSGRRIGVVLNTQMEVVARRKMNEVRWERSSRKRSRGTEDEEGADQKLYIGSEIFLKGTQSANPHNDYQQHFVDTGNRPQNYIRDTGIQERFEEYPKLKELIRLKDQQITDFATPPQYLPADLHTLELRSTLRTDFDIIYIDPPLQEYERRAPGVYTNKTWNWEEVSRLKIDEIAGNPSFVFLWCGSAEGLDEGRECLRRWGFRRCEDICWIKTNKEKPGNTSYLEPKALFQHTKEHCLMGIKGTVRRSTDGHIIHANIDIDIIIDEERPYGSTDKPEEIFKIMERFCLGRRRLHLFGSDANLRAGWVTVGPEISASNYNSEQYLSAFKESRLLPQRPDIENLRPKSPKSWGSRGRAGTRTAAGSRGAGRGAASRGGGPMRGSSGPRGGPGMRGGSSMSVRGGMGGRGGRNAGGRGGRIGHGSGGRGGPGMGSRGGSRGPYRGGH